MCRSSAVALAAEAAPPERDENTEVFIESRD